MIQYEYKVVKAPSMPWQPGSDEELDFLTSHGALGWELCAIYIGVMMYYFKRQLYVNQ